MNNQLARLWTANGPLTSQSPSSPLPLLVRADIIRSLISSSQLATTITLEFNRRSNV